MLCPLNVKLIWKVSLAIATFWDIAVLSYEMILLHMIADLIKFIVTQKLKQALFGTFKSWKTSWFENTAKPDSISISMPLQQMSKNLNNSNPQANILSGSDAQISISSTRSVCHWLKTRKFHYKKNYFTLYWHLIHAPHDITFPRHRDGK